MAGEAALIELARLDEQLSANEAVADASFPEGHIGEARVALRHAGAAIAWVNVRYYHGKGRKASYVPLGLGDIVVTVRDGNVLRRAVMIGHPPRLQEVSGLDLQQQSHEPTLASDLAADAEIGCLARGPCFLALLADALGANDWIHPDTHRQWSAGRRAAEAICSVISRGAAVKRLPVAAGFLGVDEIVGLQLNRLGWYRVQTVVVPESCDSLEEATRPVL